MPVALRPRVLLLIPHLGGGGAERVTELLARGLSADRFEVHLGLVTQNEFDAEIERLGVRVHALGANRVRGGAFRLLRLVRRLKPCIVLSGMAHLNFLVLLLRPLIPTRTRVLVRQNSTASAAIEFGGLPWYTRLLYQLLYGRADRVICQTAAMARDLTVQFGIPSSRIVVLPNPINLSAIRSGIRACGERQGVEHVSGGPHLLAVGRLSREKGFDLLLRALVTVRQRSADTKLTIAGAGPEESALKTACVELGLQDAVCFAGHVDAPFARFPGASIFVLPSRHEGMPNALLEAAAAGLPIVALPASEGVVEVLRGQPGVWLASEVSSGALADNLVAALGALRPGERFAHGFVEPFALDRAIAAYEELMMAEVSGARR